MPGSINTQDKCKRFNPEIYNLGLIMGGRGKSGFPGDHLVEMHGHLQSCSKCERRNWDYVDSHYPESSEDRTLIGIGERKIDEFYQTLETRVFE